MRIIYFSTIPGKKVNAVYEKIQEFGHELVLFVTIRGLPSMVTNNHQKAFEDRIKDLNPNIPTLIVNTMKGNLANIITALQPDIGLVLQFAFRLNKTILSIPKYGFVNLHPSMLPKYRGPNPIGWQILNNEKTLGFTFHYMDDKYDTGRIILQGTRPLTSTDNFFSIYMQVPEILMDNMATVFKLVQQGYKGEIQNDGEHSYAPFFTVEQRTINWERPAIEIDCLIRATSVWHKHDYHATMEYLVRQALFEMNDKMIRPLKSLLICPKNYDNLSGLDSQQTFMQDNSSDAKVGEITEQSTGELLVHTGNGQLLITDYERL
ncbi:unnamed protein product [Adineta ricciae]|uniref:Methionyl-tRNA formyltransferase n=1 Tax=Adineta ricciae TaxID=249248 RepID=A0A815ENS7_ADIRI|nr:unnamed protein product [Adineta ricciae]CAF1312849.1 unnamed protein product [Adineta ricciae]